MKIAAFRSTALLGAIGGSLLLLGPANAASNAAPTFARRLPLQPFLLQARGGSASRVMAKGEVETTSNKASEPLTQKASLTKKDDALVNDIELLSSILAETVKRGSPRTHELYTRFRQYGLAR